MTFNEVGRFAAASLEGSRLRLPRAFARLMSAGRDPIWDGTEAVPPRFERKFHERFGS
jgi:hypothetical protein